VEIESLDGQDQVKTNWDPLDRKSKKHYWQLLNSWKILFQSVETFSTVEMSFFKLQDKLRPSSLKITWQILINDKSQQSTKIETLYLNIFLKSVLICLDNLNKNLDVT
jgi:hypothetical protein